MSRYPSAPDRFWLSTRVADGCWEWLGGRFASGYGRFWVGPRRGGRHLRAHRYSWELHFGPIPAGLEVCHSCDNPGCVYPGHLFLGSHNDNMADMVRKGRAHRPGGDKHPGAKLTQAEADQIRASTSRTSLLAVRFGVSAWTIRRIRQGVRWPAA